MALLRLSKCPKNCVASAIGIPVTAGYLVLKSKTVKLPDDLPLKEDHGDPETPCPVTGEESRVNL